MDHKRERLEKQKVYQRQYRARLKQQRKPQHDDLGRALLDVAIATHLEQGRHEDLMVLMERVGSRLEAIGFSAFRTQEVWQDLVERYQRGWGLIRERRALGRNDKDPDGDADRG
jgi:hypothetical protein